MNVLKKNYIGYYPIGGMRVKVRVKAERNSFGRRDLKIVPMSGEGEAWVAKTSVESKDPKHGNEEND